MICAFNTVVMDKVNYSKCPLKKRPIMMLEQDELQPEHIDCLDQGEDLSVIG